MKFRVLFGLALTFILAGVFASPAAAIDRTTAVIDSVSSTSTIHTVDIASHTATDVVVSTGLLYRQICIQNLSQNGRISCSESSDLSNVPSDNSGGIFLSSAAAHVPPLPYCFQIVTATRWYCRTNANDAVSRVAVWRKR